MELDVLNQCQHYPTASSISCAWPAGMCGFVAVSGVRSHPKLPMGQLSAVASAAQGSFLRQCLCPPSTACTILALFCLHRPGCRAGLRSCVCTTLPFAEQSWGPCAFGITVVQGLTVPTYHRFGAGLQVPCILQSGLILIAWQRCNAALTQHAAANDAHSLCLAGAWSGASRPRLASTVAWATARATKNLACPDNVPGRQCAPGAATTLRLRLHRWGVALHMRSRRAAHSMPWLPQLPRRLIARAGSCSACALSAAWGVLGR